MKGEELDAALRSAEAADDYARMVNVLKHAAEHGIWDAASTWRRAAKLLYDELGDLQGARDAWQKVLDHAPGDPEARAQLAAIEKDLA
jgi:tetratricopeptide (TPR) repeat protein